MKPFEQRTYFIPNGCGWELELSRSWHAQNFDSSRRPVLMLPGLGNNKAVFSFPDHHHSWESFLVREKLEVWTVNLRGQGGSRYLGRSRPSIEIQDMAYDLGLVLEFIQHNTSTLHQHVDVIGASLGAAVMYVHAVLTSQNRMGSMVTVGGPFRWEQCHPLVSVIMSQPRLVGMVPMKGSRTLLQHTFPLLKRFPMFIRHYIQPEAIAGNRHEDLLSAVDDPNRHLARQIAQWIQTKDLIVDGINVTEGMRSVSNPLLCATGNYDGIVPPATSLAAIAASGASVKEVLWIGDQSTRFGHTDPMIHRESPQRVFLPIAQWLAQQHPVVL